MLPKSVVMANEVSALRADTSSFHKMCPLLTLEKQSIDPFENKAMVMAENVADNLTFSETGTECVACLEPVETALACGHWVHLECVQRHADSMQDICRQNGYPPIRCGRCPICRVDIPQVVPRSGTEPTASTLEPQLPSGDFYPIDINGILNEWETTAGGSGVPLYQLIRNAIENTRGQSPQDNVFMTQMAVFLEQVVTNLARPDLRFQIRLDRLRNW